MLHPIERGIVPPVLNLLWVKKIKGIGNIPADGRFIVTPNHSSFIDGWLPPCIIVPYLNKEVHMYVNKNYFRNPLCRWYLNLHGCIPVEVHKRHRMCRMPESRGINENNNDNREVNKKAFQKALYYLNKNEPVCIYPEGHRTLDGQLQKARFGAAKLAISSKAPILPFGITGSGEIFPKGKRFPGIKRVIEINIGKPITFEMYYGKENNKNILNKATRLIMKEIGRLIGREYRY